jgi:hypothetical protein
MDDLMLPEGEQVLHRFEGKNYWTQPQLEYIVTNRRLLIRNKKTGEINLIYLNRITGLRTHTFFDITGNHWYIDINSAVKVEHTIECKSKQQEQEYVSLLRNLMIQFS